MTVSICLTLLWQIVPPTSTVCTMSLVMASPILMDGPHNLVFWLIFG